MLPLTPMSASLAAVLLSRVVAGSASSLNESLSLSFDIFKLRRQSLGNETVCSLDQSKAPGNLTFCGNSTLFSVWRPKARFIAPEGWMNDPQGMLYSDLDFFVEIHCYYPCSGLFQLDDGSFHAGYQCNPQHYSVNLFSTAINVKLPDFSTVGKHFTMCSDVKGSRLLG
jgi:hypothetical protein